MDVPDVALKCVVVGELPPIRVCTELSKMLPLLRLLEQIVLPPAFNAVWRARHGEGGVDQPEV